MIGSGIAFNPCCKCDEKGMCNICELTYRRNGQLADSADIAPVRHGEWKDRYEHKYANQYYECSVCGGKALDETYVPIIGAPYCNQELSPYCPHCGAKMDGKRREE